MGVHEERYRKYAEKNNVEINEEIFGAVLEGLFSNFLSHGKFYCPCKLEKVDTNVCPCKEFRDTKECHCGLFITDKENNQ